jgi:hypothetical protein
VYQVHVYSSTYTCMYTTCTPCIAIRAQWTHKQQHKHKHEKPATGRVTCSIAIRDRMVHYIFTTGGTLQSHPHLLTFSLTNQSG